MHDAAGDGEREGGCVRPARVDGTSGLACCCTTLLREPHSLLAVRHLAGALSPTNCCLVHRFCFSVLDSHPETRLASVFKRWQRLTSNDTASSRDQQAAGDSAPERFANPQIKRLKLLLLLLLLLPLAAAVVAAAAALAAGATAVESINC